jgi:transcriptional regulator with XRE-family HTH domain
VTDRREVGRRIREIRFALNLTQEQFGQRLGVKKLAIAKYEAGRVPKLEMLNKIARLGGVSTASLFVSRGQAVSPRKRASGQDIDLAAPLKKPFARLVKELQASTPLSRSPVLRRRLLERSKELLIRCCRDLAEYRQALEVGRPRECIWTQVSRRTSD